MQNHTTMSRSSVCLRVTHKIFCLREAALVRWAEHFGQTMY